MIVTCIVYEKPREDVQALLRRASATPEVAAMAARNEVCLRLERGSQAAGGPRGTMSLVAFYCTIHDNGRFGAHDRFTAMDVNCKSFVKNPSILNAD